MEVTVGIWQSHSVMLRAKHRKAGATDVCSAAQNPLKPLSYFCIGKSIDEAAAELDQRKSALTLLLQS